MKSMPYEIKQKLRQFDKANKMAKELHYEIENLFDKYKVPYDNLVACEEFGEFAEEQSTEALSYINNCEGEIESNINDIEEVFLYFVNKS
jgi:hypothetical protein